MLNDPKECVQTARMRKWPIYALAGALILMFGVMIWAIEFSGKKKTDEKPKQEIAAVRNEKPLVPEDGGKGLATPPPPPAPEKPKNEVPQIVVVTNNEPPELRKEKDDLRKQKYQWQINALSSPLIVKKNNQADTANKSNTDYKQQSDGKKSSPDNALSREADNRQDVLERLSGGAGTSNGTNDYNPAADKDKEKFFERSKTLDRQWIAAGTRQAGQRYEVKTGAVIPAVMISGINSDLPGQIIAQVSSNVYDTADGRYLLIPQGARLYGVYDSRVIYGQSRVLVAWNRIIFPDGSAITLESMPGTDSAGYAGYEDQVNNHYFRIFGSALLMSLVTGSTSYAVDTMSPSNSSNSNSTSASMQQQMTGALAQQLGQATAQMLSKNMNIKPTLEIRPGFRFNVIVTKDLVFKEPYLENVQNERRP